MGNVILPPNYVYINGPLIFLAGPIQGTPNWQEEAIRYIGEKAPALHIASPRRREVVKGDFPEPVFTRQMDWETFHLRRAGKCGVKLFWLANEEEHFCERAYAQTSRFELGEHKMRYELLGEKMVVGIAPRFSGAAYIKRRLQQDCPDIPLCYSLEETCTVAIALT